MSYRGIYRDGIVIIQGDVDLRNGALVNVNLRNGHRPEKARGRIAAAGKSKSKELTSRQVAALFKQNAWDKLRPMTKKQRMSALLAAQGTWKDRPEWKNKSSGQVAAELRTRASRRGRDA